MRSAIARSGRARSRKPECGAERSSTTNSWTLCGLYANKCGKNHWPRLRNITRGNCYAGIPFIGPIRAADGVTGLCSLRAFAGIARWRAFRASNASIVVGVACALKPLCSIETPAPIASPAASTSRRRIRFQRHDRRMVADRLLTTATDFDAPRSSAVCQTVLNSGAGRLRDPNPKLCLNGYSKGESNESNRREYEPTQI